MNQQSFVPLKATRNPEVGPVRLQRKLAIGASNDPLEQEADRVADQVMAASTHSVISGACAPHIQRFSEHLNGQMDTAPASVDHVLAGSGRPLEMGLRQDMEQRFGHDFSGVRVHTDAAAEQSARDVNANAYTVGHNMVFGAGRFAPGTHEGRRLIAHELAHVAQSGSSSNIRRDTIYRQPAGAGGDLAAIDYEIQQLHQMPLLPPPLMVRLEQLQQERIRLLAQGTGAPVAPTAAKEESSGDDISLLMGMRQIDKDRIEQAMNRTFRFARQPAQPIPPPSAVETGCHTDPYAHHPVSTVCGQKRPDEATQATMKAMQAPKPDFDEYYRQQRAKLDRLNAAHLEARRTGKFPATNEFSPYEIAIDNEVDIVTRWQISAKEHDVGENNLEADHYNILLFRSRSEYEREYRRRLKIYDEKVACKSDHGIKWPKASRKHPDWIDCENRVNAEYYPRGHAQREAARWRIYVDIQTAMPVLTEGGPIAALGFHVAHEYLGWSTERAAAFGGALSTATGLVMLKTQQVYTNRNVGQSVAPPDEMTPERVAPAPRRDPVQPPGKTSTSIAGAVADPPPRIVTPADKPAAADDPKDSPMRRPPGGGDRAGMTSTGKTLMPHTKSDPVIEVLPRSTVPMKDFEPPEPGHYIRRKPPSAETQPQILAQAGRTTDGRLRDANTGRALEEGEAVWGHAPNYQFKEMRDMAEKLHWTQDQFDEFFADPAKWQIEYGPTNSSRVFDRIPRQRPVH